MAPTNEKKPHQEGNLVQRTAHLQQALAQHIRAQPATRFTNAPWALIAEIESFATANHLRMTYKTAKISTSRAALAAMAPRLPKVIVEFGTFVGTSAIAWAAMLREFHPHGDANIKVFTFEFDAAVADVARELVRVAGLQDVVEVLVGPGAESLKRLVAEGRVRPGEVDVVFIDHWEECYLPDLRLVEELGLFRVGSLAVADNTDFPGAPDYLAYVKKGGEGAVRYESRSLQSESTGGPSIVEVSEVVAL